MMAREEKEKDESLGDLAYMQGPQCWRRDTKEDKQEVRPSTDHSSKGLK